jgi:hypothetical protein
MQNDNQQVDAGQWPEERKQQLHENNDDLSAIDSPKDVESSNNDISLKSHDMIDVANQLKEIDTQLNFKVHAFSCVMFTLLILTSLFLSSSNLHLM